MWDLIVSVPDHCLSFLLCVSLLLLFNQFIPLRRVQNPYYIN